MADPPVFELEEVGKVCPDRAPLLDGYASDARQLAFIGRQRPACAPQAHQQHAIGAVLL